MLDWFDKFFSTRGPSLILVGLITSKQEKLILCNRRSKCLMLCKSVLQIGFLTTVCRYIIVLEAPVLLRHLKHTQESSEYIPMCPSQGREKDGSNQGHLLSLSKDLAI